MAPLLGRVAIVTGAAQGIGRGIAHCLAGDGADVVLADLALDGAREGAEQIERLGRSALAVRCDVSDAQSVADLVRRTVERFGHVDILVNNAGIKGAPGWLDEERTRPVDWDAAFQVNVKAQFLCAEAVAPHMIARRWGKIVNISSSSGREPSPFHPHYHATKAAVISYTQCLALQLAPYDINVNAICPAMVWTPMAYETHRWRRERGGEPGDDAREAFDARMRRRCPLQRETTPEDIGWAVCFLVSERARNITGQTIDVDGGAVMR
ncbi:MAG: SDR family oxidoreductase [Chloroflexi bacterium]|nr:SDR family oxidoreductase [Chloroflexota bacterium]